MKNMKKTLYVWDIDHTLFKTNANVIIRKDNKIVQKLDPVSYNSYKKKEDETVDYSEFRSAEIFRKNARPIQNILNKAKRFAMSDDNKSETILLTARSDMDNKNLFLQTFRDHGFPIDRVYVERAGNLIRYKSSASVASTKGVILRQYIKTGNYNKIVMYDDDSRNLDILIKLASLHPEITIICFLVRDDNIELYYKKVSEKKKIHTIKEALYDLEY